MDRPYTAFQLYRLALLQARPFWPHLTAVFLLGLLAMPIALLLPLPLKVAVDSAIGSYPLPGLLGRAFPIATTSRATVIGVAVSLLILLTLANLLQRFGQWLLIEHTGARLVLAFRGTLFQHVQRLSLAHHDAAGLADATYRVQYDAPAIQGLTLWGLIPLCSSLFTMIGMIAVIAGFSGRLAIVALAVSPVLILLTALHSPLLRARWEKIKTSETSTLSIVQEVFGAIRVVKAFRQEDREVARFVEKSMQGIHERVRVVLAESSLALSTGLAVGCATAAVLIIGIGEVRTGALTLGNLLMVMAYLNQLYSPLQTIGRQASEQEGALVSARRSFSLLENAPAQLDRTGTRPLDRATGAVEFRDVGFTYDGMKRAIDRVSFIVPPGTRVGIAGPTGSGKTTLLNLLIRFYDPTDGQILLDGVDLRDYRLADLRDQFAIVLQEPILFSTTIADNIAYGRPGASREAIVAAAMAAEAHDFITALPQGYDTTVGDRGMRLSGGERQRITIARAFLRDSPVLILDEPTSSVDVDTEDAIMRAMRRLMTNRTTFMIAHRLSTLEGCTMRLRLRNGRLEDAKGPYSAVFSGVTVDEGA